jgi:hypothetical protein
MPWTIPNLLLHDKPVPLANMRSHGRNRVLVCCSNLDCHQNAEIDARSFPDDVTFGDLQLRMLAPCAIIAAPTLARRGCIMVDWSRRFEDPIPLPRGRQLVTLKDAAAYIMKLPKAEQNLEDWQTAVACLIGATAGRDFVMHSRIGMLRAFEPQRRTNVN